MLSKYNIFQRVFQINQLLQKLTFKIIMHQVTNFGLFLLSTCLFVSVTPSNILFFHLMGTSSHRTSIWPLAKELANRGHHVTYIFPAKNRDGVHPQITEITPSKMVPIVRDIVGDFDINIRLNNTLNSWIWRMFTVPVDLCKAFYDSPEIIEWLSTPSLKFDLVLIDVSFGECVYGLVNRFQAKHILFTPVFPHWLWDGFGIVPETSSVPEAYFLGDPNGMGFVSRLLTTLAPLIFRLAYLKSIADLEPIIKEKLNLPEMPSLLEFEKNTSLVLYNGYFIETYALSVPPMIVSYSGLWCSKKYVRTANQFSLPKDIQDFIGNSDDGFIYVSFGSAVMVSNMPENILSKFFSAFEAFPEIKFLWRWSGTEPKNTPKNLLLKPWFPQRDILAHGKIRGFVTQAGRPSCQEAFCYGVPMITFSIFADQLLNADRLKYLGVSLTFDIGKFTSTELQKGIHDLINNPAYTARMKELSAMFRDRPVDPLENAVFWTEYVLRHNTSLLKPLAINQTWWQRRLLDVYFVVFIVIVSMFALIFVLVYFIYHGPYQICRTKKVLKRE